MLCAVHQAAAEAHVLRQRTNAPLRRQLRVFFKQRDDDPCHKKRKQHKGPKHPPDARGILRRTTGWAGKYLLSEAEVEKKEQRTHGVINV